MRLIIAIALSLAEGTLVAATHHYLLPHFPKEMGSCLGVTEQLSQRFSTDFGLNQVSGKCVKVKATGFQIRISYKADSPLELVTTVRDRSGNHSYGGYASKAECDSQLDSEKQRFGRETGLSPFVAYCFEDVYEPSDPWVMLIDAFGEADKRPGFIHKHIHGELVQTKPALVAERFAERLQVYGQTPVVFSKIKEWGLDHFISILVYEREPNRLHSLETSAVPTEQACFEQLEKLRSAVGSLAHSQAGLYCVYSRVLQQYSPTGFWFFKKPVEIQKGFTEYGSQSSCRAALAKEKKDFSKVWGAKPLAGFCSHSWSRWRVHFLVENQ